MEIDFKKILKQVTSLGKKDTIKSPISPHRDWRMVFIVFVVLAIAVSGGSAYMFMQIEQDQLFTSEGGSGQQVKKFNTSKLIDTIKQFEQKEEELRRLRATRPQIVDPSI